MNDYLTKMTYLQSSKGVTITHKRAMQELKNHGVVDTHEFYSECGIKDSYKAYSVLKYLGY